MDTYRFHSCLNEAVLVVSKLFIHFFKFFSYYRIVDKDVIVAFNGLLEYIAIFAFNLQIRIIGVNELNFMLAIILEMSKERHFIIIILKDTKVLSCKL
jgi:hypothetical protein